MVRSILRTVGVYLFLQLSFGFVFVYMEHLPASSWIIFFVPSLLIHTGLGFFLIGFRKAFTIIPSGETLHHINIANKITLLRISSLPTIAFLLVYNETIELRVVLPVLLIMLFMTDSFDGQVARRMKQITRMGQMLDSISDYSLLAVISIVYYINHIVPRWMFYIIFFRLLLQALGMFVFILLRKPLPVSSTWGGKITIATIMTLYVLEMVRLFTPHNLDALFIALEYLSGLIILLLSFEKARIFFRQGRHVSRERKDQD